MLLFISITVILETDMVTFGPKLSFGQPGASTLGDHGAIQGYLGAQEKRPWGPGLDFYVFWVDDRTLFL